jgi:HTH-type transcriptional regulator/antitoxin HipB
MSAKADISQGSQKAMRIRTPVDLGALIRDRRTALGLDQKTLADTIGVSRQWIVEIEKGKPRAEIALVLRALGALGIPLTAGDAVKEKSKGSPQPVDIDSIISAARKKRK